MNEIVAKLREYNRWRRGDEEIAQPDPGEIGRLLDAVCEMVGQLERERDLAEDERIDMAKQLRSEQERHAKCQNERDEAIRQRDETNRSSKYACDYIYEQKLKAERERNECAAMCCQYRQERDIAEQDATNYHARTIELINERDKTRQERDEAREEIRDWKRLHDAAERGVDLTIAEGTISDLLKQRDEARAVAHDLASAASHCLGWHDCRLNIGEKITATLQHWRRMEAAK